jgi:hypothetical protein
MKIRKLFVILGGLLSLYILLNLFVKINYSNDEYYLLGEYQVNDSILFQGGKVFIGENYKGKIEAIILPEQVIVGNRKKSVEYVYMRFFPRWFEEHLEPNLKKIDDPKAKIYAKGLKRIHEGNFQNYMHFGKYPVVKYDYVPMVIHGTDNEFRMCLEYDFTTQEMKFAKSPTR